MERTPRHEKERESRLGTGAKPFLGFHTYDGYIVEISPRQSTLNPLQKRSRNDRRRTLTFHCLSLALVTNHTRKYTVFTRTRFHFIVVPFLYTIKANSPGFFSSAFRLLQNSSGPIQARDRNKTTTKRGLTLREVTYLKFHRIACAFVAREPRNRSHAHYVLYLAWHYY